jgi:hypothetical protein
MENTPPLGALLVQTAIGVILSLIGMLMRGFKNEISRLADEVRDMKLEQRNMNGRVTSLEAWQAEHGRYADRRDTELKEQEQRLRSLERGQR